MQKLKIDNLCVEVDGKIILDNFSLEIKEGEIHAIMGPNGTGKSTLSKVIMGDSNYKIVFSEGEETEAVYHLIVDYENESIAYISPDLFNVGSMEVFLSFTSVLDFYDFLP